MKKRDVRLKGQLRMYMQWPMIMTVLLVAMNIWIYAIDRKAGGVMSVFIIVYVVIVGALYYYNPAIATSSWIFDRQTITVIGKHVFAI